MNKPIPILDRISHFIFMGLIYLGVVLLAAMILTGLVMTIFG